MRNILHCDMNNFYASVECMLDPTLKKYPIAVCGSVEERHGKVTMTTGVIELKCPNCHRVVEVDLSLRRGNVKYRLVRVK